MAACEWIQQGAADSSQEARVLDRGVLGCHFLLWLPLGPRIEGRGGGTEITTYLSLYCRARREEKERHGEVGELPDNLITHLLRTP